MSQTPVDDRPPAGTEARQHETIDVLALVFAIIVPVVGLILALVSRSNARRDGRRPDGLTTAALIVSIVLTAIGVIAGILSIIFTFVVVGQTTAALKDIGTSPTTGQSQSVPAGTAPDTVSVSVQSTGQTSGPSAGFDAAAKTVLESRLKDAGVTGATVTGSPGAGFQVQFPDAVSADTRSKVVAAVQPDTSLDGFDPVQYVSADPFTPDSGADVRPATACKPAGPTMISDAQYVACDTGATPNMYLLGATPAVSLTDITSVALDEQGHLNVTFNPAGTAALRTLTTSLVEKTAPANQMAIVAGGHVQFAPTVGSAITDGKLLISGDGIEGLAASLEFASQTGTFTVQ